MATCMETTGESEMKNFVGLFGCFVTAERALGELNRHDFDWSAMSVVVCAELEDIEDPHADRDKLMDTVVTF